jgi:predicted  nucleic acid-binding Zn-ribbon protein
VLGEIDLTAEFISKYKELCQPDCHVNVQPPPVNPKELASALERTEALTREVDRFHSETAELRGKMDTTRTDVAKELKGLRDENAKLTTECNTLKRAAAKVSDEHKQLRNVIALQAAEIERFKQDVSNPIESKRVRDLERALGDLQKRHREAAARFENDLKRERGRRIGTEEKLGPPNLQGVAQKQQIDEPSRRNPLG